MAKGDIQTAVQLADRAVAIDEAAIKAGEAGIYYLPTLLINRSTVELAAARADQAAADASRALNLSRDGINPKTFSSIQGIAFLALGKALHAQGKRDQAHAAFRSAAENLQSTVGPNHPDTRSAQREAEVGTHGP